VSTLSSLRAAPIIGLVIGLALGLAYTWVIAPVELVNTYPALLRTDYRWDWVRLAALSYVADGDMERARLRWPKRWTCTPRRCWFTSAPRRHRR